MTGDILGLRSGPRRGRKRTALVSIPVVLQVVAALLLAGASIAARADDPDVIERPARPDRGFQVPYFLYVPPAISDARAGRLLVMPNNTGHPDDDFGVHKADAQNWATDNRVIANRVGAILLVPTFIRPASAIYTHALSRAAMLNKDPRDHRPDLQLIAMLDDAREWLAHQGISVFRKAFLFGFSGSGMFVNRFVFMHPDRVQAAVIGSPGGWPILPVDAWQGNALTYPVGTYGWREITGRSFDLEAVRAVPMYLFLGSEDTNDSVPFDDSYEERERALVMTLFGTTPVGRWPAAEGIYRAYLPKAKFTLYPGLGHATLRDTWRDVVAFLKDHLDTRAAVH
jgi:dienelactone hydrolase